MNRSITFKGEGTWTPVTNQKHTELNQGTWLCSECHPSILISLFLQYIECILCTVCKCSYAWQEHLPKAERLIYTALYIIQIVSKQLHSNKQENNIVKVPLLWVMKGSYFGFGSPQQQVDMQGQKTLSFSYNMHLFLLYLLNDSQTIRSMMNFSKPLLCVTLICCDWSISFKAVFVSF